MLDHPHKVPALGCRECGSRAWRLAADETGSTFGMEPQPPVADGLETDVADPGCVAPAAAIVDLRQREKPPDLVGMARPHGQAAKLHGVKVGSKRDRCGHGERRAGNRQEGSHPSRPWNPNVSPPPQNLV